MADLVKTILIHYGVQYYDEWNGDIMEVQEANGCGQVNCRIICRRLGLRLGDSMIPPHLYRARPESRSSILYLHGQRSGDFHDHKGHSPLSRKKHCPSDTSHQGSCRSRMFNVSLSGTLIMRLTYSPQSHFQPTFYH